MHRAVVTVVSALVLLAPAQAMADAAKGQVQSEPAGAVEELGRDVKQGLDAAGDAIERGAEAVAEEVERAIDPPTVISSQNSLAPGAFGASGFLGADVEGMGGEDVASVEDVILDANHAVQEVILSRGGVLGVGERYAAVPFSAVTKAPDSEETFVVAMTREQLEAAPEYTFAESQTAGDQVRLSRVVGADVIGSSGETVAGIENVILSQTGSATYAILAVGGFLGASEKLVAVPFERLRPGPSAGDYALDMTEAELSAVAEFQY